MMIIRKIRNMIQYTPKLSIYKLVIFGHSLILRALIQLLLNLNLKNHVQKNMSMTALYTKKVVLIVCPREILALGVLKITI